MKVRTGFVSNSSSSSYMIVGVENYRDPRLGELAEKDKARWGWGGLNEGNQLVFIGSEADYEDAMDGNLMKDYEPYGVGVYADGDIRAGKPIDEIKERFISIAKSYGITFTKEEVDLHYGETSSE